MQMYGKYGPLANTRPSTHVDQEKINSPTKVC